MNQITVIKEKIKIGLFIVISSNVFFIKRKYILLMNKKNFEGRIIWYLEMMNVKEFKPKSLPKYAENEKIDLITPARVVKADSTSAHLGELSAKILILA